MRVVKKILANGRLKKKSILGATVRFEEERENISASKGGKIRDRLGDVFF